MYTPYQSRLNKSPLSKSPFSKSPFSKSPTHRGLLAVFQEFCMVEQCLCDLRDVGDRESQLQIGHQVLLLSSIQQETNGSIEQLTAGESNLYTVS